MCNLTVLKIRDGRLAYWLSGLPGGWMREPTAAIVPTTFYLTVSNCCLRNYTCRSSRNETRSNSQDNWL